MAKFLNIVLLIVVFPCLLSAQQKQYKFEHLSVENGLSSAHVRCFLQDHKGFIWIGTPSGLNRFDGYQFKIFKHDPVDSTTISNNSITALYQDSLGYLWIGTDGGGLNKFDVMTETFTSWYNDPDDPNSICDDHITALHGARDGGLWIGTFDGLARIDHDDLYRTESEFSFRIFKHDSTNRYSLSHNFIKSIYEDKNGMVWIGTERGGLNRYNPREEKFYHRFNAEENDLSWKGGYSIPFVPVMALYGDILKQEEIFWIGTANGVFKFDHTLRKCTRYRPEKPGIIYETNGHFRSLLKDQDGMLWIATQKNGILLFDEKKDNLISLNHDYTDPYSLSHNWISALYRDEHGTIWVGTTGGGISQYDSRRWKFEHYPLESDELGGKKNFSVTAIFEDLEEEGKVLWIGAGDRGLLQYNRETNTIKRFYFNGRSDYHVNFIYQDQSEPNNIWICCRGDGLLKLNKKSESFTQYKKVSPEKEFQTSPNRSDLISTSYVNTFIRDRKGHFWLASGLGVYMFDPQTSKFIPYLHDPENNNSLSDNYVRIVFEDQEGKLWFGTVFGGLNRFDPEKNRFIRFQNNPSDSMSISSNNITSIHQDKNGTMWIGTADGLNRYDPLHSYFIRYGKKDGFFGEKIWGLLEDRQENLWFSSGQGLTQFNPKTSKCINYDVRDGLQGYDFNGYAYHQSRRGEMFYGGQNGFNAFYPESLQTNDAVPQVVLTNLKIFNESVKPGPDSPLKQTLTETSEIVLKNNQSIFSFEFAALDYTIPYKNKYAYRMDGVDPQWVYTDASRRFATYTQLAPGEYTFRVKASNNDGIWNEEGTSVKVIILPPWWQTGWAYLAFSLLLGTFLVGTVRFELQRRQRKLEHQLQREQELRKLEEAEHRAVVAELQQKTAEARKEAEKEQMRSRIASDLHDEIGSNLSSIALISQVLDEKFKVPKLMKIRLREIPRIARLTAESMRDIVWFINPENDDMDKLLTKMRETANMMLEMLDFTFTVPETGVIPQTDLNFRRNLYLIYKECLQNIIKHSRAQKAEIELQQVDSCLILRVKDNGVGFDTGREYSGNGLKNLQRRAVELRGKLAIVSEAGKGTYVEIMVNIDSGNKDIS